VSINNCLPLPTPPPSRHPPQWIWGGGRSAHAWPLTLLDSVTGLAQTHCSIQKMCTVHMLSQVQQHMGEGPLYLPEFAKVVHVHTLDTLDRLWDAPYPHQHCH